MYGRKLKCCNPVKNPWMTILNKTNSPPKWNCLTVSVDLVIPKKWLSSRCMQFNSNVLSKSIPICFPSHDTQVCFPNQFQSAFQFNSNLLSKSWHSNVLSKSIIICFPVHEVQICFPVRFQSAFQFNSNLLSVKIHYIWALINKI